MKRVGIQGIFTRLDLIELIEILIEKGARYAALLCRDQSLKVVCSESLKNGIDSAVIGLWLNTTPFDGKLTFRSNIGHDFPGSFGIFFDGCTLEDGELGEMSVGTISPAADDQLKIWESGLRMWKKRVTRDVYVYNRDSKMIYSSKKLNVSRDAVSGYDRGHWLLVSPLPGMGHDLIHPLVAQRKSPFS